jgi:hypothetical protein
VTCQWTGKGNDKKKDENKETDTKVLKLRKKTRDNKVEEN